VSAAHDDDEALRLEREAVRQASAPGDLVARDPEAHRSVGWHLGRLLLRRTLVWALLVAVMIPLGVAILLLLD
jgi:hypothetical protein